MKNHTILSSIVERNLISAMEAQEVLTRYGINTQMTVEDIEKVRKELVQSIARPQYQPAIGTRLAGSMVDGAAKRIRRGRVPNPPKGENIRRMHNELLEAIRRKTEEKRAPFAPPKIKREGEKEKTRLTEAIEQLARNPIGRPIIHIETKLAIARILQKRGIGEEERKLARIIHTNPELSKNLLSVLENARIIGPYNANMKEEQPTTRKNRTQSLPTRQNPLRGRRKPLH
ncbi:MAG: hypothetical protein V1776_00695 [Candidatus Diapherotrites archaeon]